MGLPAQTLPLVGHPPRIQIGVPALARQIAGNTAEFRFKIRGALRSTSLALEIARDAPDLLK